MSPDGSAARLSKLHVRVRSAPLSSYTTVRSTRPDSRPASAVVHEQGKEREGAAGEPLCSLILAPEGGRGEGEGRPGGERQCHAMRARPLFHSTRQLCQCSAVLAARRGQARRPRQYLAPRQRGRLEGRQGVAVTSTPRIRKLDSWALLCHRGREVFENSLTHPHDVHYHSGGRAPSNTPRTAHSVAVKEGGKEGEGEGASTEGQPQAGGTACFNCCCSHPRLRKRKSGREGVPPPPRFRPS